MRPPRWTTWLLRQVAEPDEVEDVLGDIEQLYRRRCTRRGRTVAVVLTFLEAVDLSRALFLARYDASDDETLSAAREARPSVLDFKLGLRMLRRYPGLTVVAVVSIAFAITLGATNLEYNTAFLYPRLPFAEGDRIVELRRWDLSDTRLLPTTTRDFIDWRAGLRSVGEVGAFRTVRRNLIRADGPAGSVVVAEMTAAAFEIARVPPVLGRGLLESDEVAGGADVLVLGHETWQTLFDADPGVIGTDVQVGAVRATVVGVMPPDFGWPWAHDVWVPLRLSEADPEAEPAALQVVARLGPGVSLRQASDELAAVERARHGGGEPGQSVRADVARYGRLPMPFSEAALAGLYFGALQIFVALMLLVCANVMLLLYARTSARETEIALRAALGASRARIVTQLFVESLVLAAVAATVGLCCAQLAMEWTAETLLELMAETASLDESPLPFWQGSGLSGATVVWAGILTTLGAALAGIVPALKVTGPGLHPRLQRAGSGRYGLEFGALWTAVIVIQIAVTVAFVPLGIGAGMGTALIDETPFGFAAEEYLTAEVSADGDLTAIRDAMRGASRPAGTSLDASTRRLADRLSEDPTVRAVTRLGHLPGAPHPRRWIEVHPVGREPPNRRRVQVSSVDSNSFTALGVSMVAGRDFDGSDRETGDAVVIVNEEFVRIVLGGRSAIGRTLSYTRRGGGAAAEADTAPRYRIIGVVRQIAMSTSTIHAPVEGAGIYHLLDADASAPIRMVLHTSTDPTSYAPRLHATSRDLDPTLQLQRIRPMDQSTWALRRASETWFTILSAAGAVAAILSLAGIFAVTSFTVSRRTRDIGVRVALGADPRRIVRAVFRRALNQVGMGIGGGVVLLGVFMWMYHVNYGYRLTQDHLGLLLLYLAIVPLVCLGACVAPMTRALSVQPAEALRADG